MQKTKSLLPLTSFGLTLFVIGFIVIVKQFHFHPTRQSVEWIFFLPLVAVGLAIISLFSRDNRKYLSIFSLIIWSIFYYPLISETSISFINKHFKSNLAVGKNKDTPLHIAARNNDVEQLRKALDNHADINEKNSSKYTPLMLAVNERNYEAADFLLSNGASINECSTSVWSAMMIACSQPYPELVKLLIQYGADINAPLPDCNPNNKQARYPVESVMRGHANQEELLETFNILIENNLNLDVKISGELQRTLLHEVVSLEIAKQLINKGADVNARDAHNRTPLHTNITEQVLKLLIEHGADVNAKDDKGLTPLATASKTEIIELLKKHGAEQ